MPSMPYYNQIALINKSISVSDIDASTMVEALNKILPKFCYDWSIAEAKVLYIPKASTIIPTSAYKMYMLDTADISGVLAYHDLYLDVPYGKVFAKTILSNNGVMLYEPTLTKSTVAQTLAHEVFELLIDPRCNIWWMNYNTGTLVAAEVVDPVQNNVVVVTLTNGTNVGICDWILPSWQDAQNTTGPFNYLNTLTKPFEIKNGYAIVINNSKVTTVYGDTLQPITNSHSQLSGRIYKRLRTWQ